MPSLAPYPSHSSLIKFYGAFYREGAITIALEYMDGGSLQNVLHQVGPMPEWVLANMTYQILWGLAYMKHDRRVHRDIKPSNLLINSLGEVKVTDFGISAELQNSIAMCGTFVGTFKYMSPERIKSEKYSYSSDIWSLGLVILECATGQYPYQEEETAIGMVQTIVENDPPKLDPERFSAEFCQFISCCLQRDPAARLPAEALLGSPWMARWGALGLQQAKANICTWIESLG
jgi:serine/threonine protein kinase